MRGTKTGYLLRVFAEFPSVARDDSVCGGRVMLVAGGVDSNQGARSCLTSRMRRTGIISPVPPIDALLVYARLAGVFVGDGDFLFNGV